MITKSIVNNGAYTVSIKDEKLKVYEYNEESEWINDLAI